MNILLKKLDEIIKHLEKTKNIALFIKATAQVVDNETFIEILNKIEDRLELE